MQNLLKLTLMPREIRFATLIALSSLPPCITSGIGAVDIMVAYVCSRWLSLSSLVGFLEVMVVVFGVF